MRHGRLPLSQFYASDLERNRKRCKVCAHEVTRRWWKAHPAQRVWKTFVQRAKRRFGSDAMVGVTWKSHGHRLLAGRQLPVSARLEWEPSASVLDLDALRLTRTTVTVVETEQPPTPADGEPA